MSTQIPANEKPPVEAEDIAAEFAELGKKLRNTINTAWTSEERLKVQKEVEAGLVRLRDEMNAAAKTVRESETGHKVEAEVMRVKADVESGKVTDEVRKGIVTGLRTLGEALDKLANNFTPLDQTPKK